MVRINQTSRCGEFIGFSLRSSRESFEADIMCLSADTCGSNLRCSPSALWSRAIISGMEDFRVDESLTGTGDDCEIVVTYQSIRFIIESMRPDAVGSPTIEGQLLHNLDMANEDEDDELAFDQCLENINDIAVSTCERIMRNIAALQPAKTVPLSLERILYPPTFLLQLVTVGDHLEVLQHDDVKMSSYKHTPLWLISEPYLDLGLPMVQASDVEFIECIHFQKVIHVS